MIELISPEMLPVASVVLRAIVIRSYMYCCSGLSLGVVM